MEKKEREIKHVRIGRFIFKIDEIRSIEDTGVANTYRIELCNGFTESVQLTSLEYERVIESLTLLPEIEVLTEIFQTCYQEDSKTRELVEEKLSKLKDKK